MSSAQDQPGAMRLWTSTPRLTVIGTGYLGATHAVCMADLGFEVVGLDVDPDKVAALNSGRVPFFEPGLDPLLQKNLDSGRLRFTTDYSEVAEFGDVHFICVGTPQQAGSHAANMAYVDAAFGALVPLLRRPALLVGKSTVPAGTAERLEAMIAEQAAVPGVMLAWNPEFLREGFAVEDTLRPDRIVIGVSSPAPDLALREVYRPILQSGTPCLTTDLATAQLVKVAANAFLATKISFINAMSELCDLTGADVLGLSQALSHDARIGGRFLAPGLGFGGGCLPKDIRAFQARAHELGGESSVAFLAEVDKVNARCRSRALALARRHAGGSLAGKRVAVLGCSFKPNSDDVRDSPALEICARLHDEGAVVVAHDPVAMVNAARVCPQIGYADTVHDAVAGADVVMLLTEWADFAMLDPEDIAPLVAARCIVDARNALDPVQWRAAGWTYSALGRP